MPDPVLFNIVDYGAVAEDESTHTNALNDAAAAASSYLADHPTDEVAVVVPIGTLWSFYGHMPEDVAIRRL